MPDSDANLGLGLASALLQQVGSFLRSLSSVEIEALANGDARLSLEYRDGTRRRRSKSVPKVDVEQVLEQLASLPSREQGLQFLDSLDLRKTQLEQLARRLDVPMQRADTVTKLRDRLIESAIGYRLRSEAIRGVEPKPLSDAPESSSENPKRTT